MPPQCPDTSTNLLRLPRRLPQRDRMGRRICPAVGDTQQDVANAQLLHVVLGAAADMDVRLAVGRVADLDIGPADAAAPAGAEAFQDCFLGGPAAGKVLDRVLAGLAIANFSLRV